MVLFFNVTLKSHSQLASSVIVFLAFELFLAMLSDIFENN